MIQIQRFSRRTRMTPASTLLVAGFFVYLLASGPALAIGPADQVIPDAPNPLSLGATGALSGNGSIGTGTVIGTKIVGTTGFVTILTADHVAATHPQYFAIGSGIGGNYSMSFDTSTSKTFTSSDAKNTNNLPQDVSVMLGTVTGLNQGSQALAIFNLLSKNLPTIFNTDQATNPFDNVLQKAVSFTQIGYGYQGQYNDNIPINGEQERGFQLTPPPGGTNVPYGVRGFENNRALIFASPAVESYKDGNGKALQYFEPINIFHSENPDNIGEGAGMPGDSGGPLYTQAPNNPVSILVTRNNTTIAIPVFNTNSLTALFVAGVIATDKTGAAIDPLTILNASNEYAVPIEKDAYDWLQPFAADPTTIPEPGTWALLVLGGVPLLARWHWARRGRIGSPAKD